MYKFKAPFDSLVKVITWGTLTLLTCMIILFLFIKAIPAWFPMLMLLFFGVVVYLTYAYSPLGFEIKPNYVVIVRKIKPVLIGLDKIREVKVDLSAATLKCVRLFGSGGLFGFFGTFYSSQLKVHKRYVTCRKNSVLIVADKKYVITPEKPELFVQLLQERINRG